MVKTQTCIRWDTLKFESYAVWRIRIRLRCGSESGLVLVPLPGTVNVDQGAAAVKRTTGSVIQKCQTKSYDRWLGLKYSTGNESSAASLEKVSNTGTLPVWFNFFHEQVPGTSMDPCFISLWKQKKNVHVLPGSGSSFRIKSSTRIRIKVSADFKNTNLMSWGLQFFGRKINESKRMHVEWLIVDITTVLQGASLSHEEPQLWPLSGPGFPFPHRLAQTPSQGTR
jgi:hypothetical protein